MHNVIQAAIAARAICFVSKIPLLPKGAVGRKEKRDLAPLSNKANLLSVSNVRTKN